MVDIPKLSEKDSMDVKYDVDAEMENLAGFTTSQSIDESLAQAILVFTEEERRKLMSELEHKEVFLVSILYAHAKEFNDDLLEHFLDQFLISRISKERKGRKEIVEIAKANLQKATGKGLLRKLLGRRGGDNI